MKKSNNEQIVRPLGISIVAFLMIVFGLVEIMTSFTHTFFGLTTSQAAISTIIGSIIGAFYFASGFLVLANKRRLAIIAILLLIADVIGRILMVIAGLYPVGAGYQAFGIIIGTLIVVFFAIYVGLKLKSFRH